MSPIPSDPSEPRDAETSALVSPHALRGELEAVADEGADERDDERPLLLDVRWTLEGPQRDAYLAGHIPGAVFCDLEADLSSPPGDRGRHPLPTAASMTVTMRRLGVARGRRVVVYDGGSSLPASRAWWCLRWAGHARTRLLDGGLPAWVAAGGPLEQGDVAAVEAPEAEAHVGSMPTVSVEQVVSGEADILVDVRAPERFRGEVEPVDPVAGHIPGAQSYPATSLFSTEGRLRSPNGLRVVLEPLLARVRERRGSSSAERLALDTPCITSYCGSGVTATQLVLALHEVGVAAALYPGSWSEWIRDPARPVATKD